MDYLLPPTATLAELDYAIKNGITTPLADGYCRVRLNDGVEPTINMLEIDADSFLPDGVGVFI